MDLQDNHEFLVRESELLNNKVYAVKQKKYAGTSEEMDKNNREFKENPRKMKKYVLTSGSGKKHVT